MKLKALLHAHEKHHSPLSIKNNLGDAYLIKKNPIYRKIREETLKANFKFSENRFGNYDVFPLNELPNLLSKKIIPYGNNVSPLLAIEKSAPGVFQWNELPPLKANQIFHESAHAVANTLIQKHLPLLKKKSASTGIAFERNLALRNLLEESFANACESIANVFSEDEIHDEFLFKNSYVMESEAMRKTLRRALGVFGFEVIFRLMILSFLHANLLKTSDFDKNLIRSIRIAFGNDQALIGKLKDRGVRDLTQIFRAGLELDTEFTEFTNRFCLRMLGIKTELRRLFAFDFLAYFEDYENVEDCLAALAGTLIAPS